MAMVVLLVDGYEGAISVGPDVADHLARLGVTNVAVVGDRQMTGLVLEGWLFDVASAPEAARGVVGPDRSFRVLQPRIHLAVSARLDGGTDVSQATIPTRDRSGSAPGDQPDERRLGAHAQGRS